MKFKLFIILVLTLIIIEVNTKSVEKRSNMRRHKLTPTPAKTVTNHTKALEPLILNSIGRKVYVKNATDIILTKFPYEITRCDQVVTFKGQFIPDFNEYRGRADGFFTLTAHYANLFAEDNANKLLRSVLLSEVSTRPHIFHGSGGCILISSKDGPQHNISICLNDPKQQQNILEVLKSFTDCRGGSTITKIDKLKVADMIKTCGGKGKFVNPFKLIKKLQAKKTKISKFRKDANWFHPGSDNVPGVPPPTHDSNKSVNNA